jgi:GDP-mannose 6-dehydrogenase
MVTLIETLIGKGLKLAIYDRDVEMARLFGANKEYIERGIPHISELLHADLNDVIDASEVIIIGKKEDQFRALSDRPNKDRIIIDLVRLFDGEAQRTNYQGVCW